MDEGQKKYRVHTIIIILIGIIVYLCLLRGQGGINSLHISYEKIYATDGRYNGLLILKGEFSSDGEKDESENKENVSYDFDEIKEIIINKSETPGFAQDTFILEKGGEATLFLADGKRGLRVYNLKDKGESNQPQFHTVLNLPDAKSMVVHDDIMYVAAGKHGVILVDISKPKSPFIKYSYPLKGYVSDIDIYVREITTTCNVLTQSQAEKAQPGQCTETVENFYLLVAAGDEGLVLINPENPHLPGDYSKLELPDSVSNVLVDSSDSSTRAFVGGEGGFYIVDFADATDMVLAGSFETEKPVQDIFVKNNLAYLAAGKQGLIIADISNESHPKNVGNIDTPGFAHAVELKHHFAIIADGEAGIRVIDVSNSKKLTEAGYYEPKLVEASLGRMSIDLGLWIVFLFLGLLFVANFVLPIQSISDRYRTLTRILYYWFNKQGPLFCVESGKMKPKVAKNPPSGPGVTVLDSNSALVFHDKNGEPVTHRTGADFFKKNEYLVGTADLHKQTISIGPLLDEDPFAFRLDGETIRAYKERYQRRMRTSGQTCDGKEVVPTIKLVYAIDTSSPSGCLNKGIETAVVEPQHRSVAGQRHAPVVFHRVNRDPAPDKGGSLLIDMCIKLWRDYLGRFEYDELFPTVGGGADTTALEKILAMMRMHLMQPEVDELDAHGKFTGNVISSPQFSSLSANGLRVVDIAIEKVNIPES